MSVRIATSLRGELRALASQGIFAVECHAQLHSILLQKLGPEHAALLAEPQHDAGGNTVDWYAQGQGPARPVKDLPESEAGDMTARAGSLAADIVRLATSLSADAQARQALSGQLLRQALQHPSTDDLWVVDGRPVLINWGFAPGAVGAQPQDLSRLGALAPPPPPPAQSAPAPVPPAPSGCLPWLLPLLLLLLLFWLLGAALGLLPSPLPSGCLPVDRAGLEAQQNRAASLDDELARLWRDLENRAAQCRPAQPAPMEPKPVEPEKEEPVQPEPEIVQPEFVQPQEALPPQPEPKPEPKAKPQPKPEPEPRPEPKPEPKAKSKDEPLNIPGDAAKKNDLSFLEGCWTSETGLFSHPSNEPVVAEYCFDKNGKGRRFVRERNGQVCSGGAQARFQGNRLQFDSGEARCPRGRSYVPQKVDCTGSENSTQCKGRELGGANLTWDARFRRK